MDCDIFKKDLFDIRNENTNKKLITGEWSAFCLVPQKQF